MRIHNDIEQNSDAWYNLRMGLITASGMKDVLAKGQGKTRNTYMNKRIDEIIYGVPTESYKSAEMERGHEQEAEGVAAYEEKTGYTVDHVGFITGMEHIGNDYIKGIGYSPDGMVGDKGLVDIKTKAPHLLIDCMLADKIPTEFMAQVQTGLWVAEREWFDIILYYKGRYPLIKRIMRDEDYIDNLIVESQRFYNDMQEKLTILQSKLNN